MALSAAAAVTLRRNLPLRPVQAGAAGGIEEVSCSYACASQSRTLVKSRRCATGSGNALSSLLRERKQIRDKFKILASNENNETEESVSSEADVEALESRLGLGRRARREGGGEPKAKPPPPPKPKMKKKWEDMNLAEQAWSLYIDPDKGILYWLNKLAYASIFAIIGAWIVFRFVGPALGWYELDSPLLPPDQVLGL